MDTKTAPHHPLADEGGQDQDEPVLSGTKIIPNSEWADFLEDILNKIDELQDQDGAEEWELVDAGDCVKLRLKAKGHKADALLMSSHDTVVEKLGLRELPPLLEGGIEKIMERVRAQVGRKVDQYRVWRDTMLQQQGLLQPAQPSKGERHGN